MLGVSRAEAYRIIKRLNDQLSSRGFIVVNGRVNRKYLAEHKQYQVRATVKSYRKMRDDALNGDPIAKERYEKTLARRREAYHTKKSEQTA